ncbi:MAG: GNAT family N-acetyltransferase [Desulfatirhabdiaceae bacterium]
MVEPEYHIRTMTRYELDIAVEWAAKEGWNPGRYDADCFYTADSNGFLIGLLNGDPVATISAVRYGNSFGFIGFYIVRPKYRGKGYGLRIWNAALQYLRGRNIGLDGVIAQQDNYRKSGFQLAYRNIRYEGVGGGDVSKNPNIVPLSDVPFEDVVNYDRPFFPDNRKHFLQCWLSRKDSSALGIMENGVLAGYGRIRVCRTGYKIGPLFADNRYLAESLFMALKATIKQNEPIYFDPPEVNRPAVELAERHGMKAVFETARMYTGVFPKLPFNRLFGVTTFELG